VGKRLVNHTQDAQSWQRQPHHEKRYAADIVKTVGQPAHEADVSCVGNAWKHCVVIDSCELHCDCGDDNRCHTQLQVSGSDEPQRKHGGNCSHREYYQSGFARAIRIGECAQNGGAERNHQAGDGLGVTPDNLPFDAFPDDVLLEIRRKDKDVDDDEIRACRELVEHPAHPAEKAISYFAVRNLNRGHTHAITVFPYSLIDPRRRGPFESMIAVRALEQSGVEKAAPNHAFRKFTRAKGKNASSVQVFSTLTHRKCT